MNGDSLNANCSAVINFITIDVSNKNISNLEGIQAFVNLEYLICSLNDLITLPALPSNLTYLNCHNNQISSLPSLPLSLTFLQCDNNQIISLPPLPSSLIYLFCGDNQITSLPSLPSSLTNLSCWSNQITSLPALPSSLITLGCSYNQISILPPLPNLIRLQCNNNLITCFPSLPSSLITSYWFNISNNPFSCLPNYVLAMNAQTLAIPLCDNGNQNGCPSAEGIIGRVFNDQNNNCNLNTNETNIINVAIKLYDDQNNLLAQSATFSNNGLYNFPIENGNYKVKVDTLNKPFRITCASPGDSINFMLTPAQPLFTAPSIPVRCKPGFDVGVQSIVPVGWVFPGQVHTLRILAGDMSRWINLNCTQGIAGQVQITVNGPVSYSGVPSGALVPQVLGNVFTYNISNFANVNFQNSFWILLTTDTTAQAGESVCVNVSVTPTLGDNMPANNQMQFCYNVNNSYDPNRKDVSPEIVLPGYEDWITYTVYFQNTGNAPAFNIRLRDTLSNNFDYSTFELLNYSHPNSYDLRDGILNFLFPNIMLPDSTSDPLGSIGFVQFRMKPLLGLPFGEQINNQVAIYFDFNPPIFTNVANTSYTQCEQFSSTLQLNDCESVTINNITYTESGTYFQNLQNLNGCDSLLTVQLSINKNVIMLNQTACGNYNLNGIIYNESGTYQQTLVNNLGCDSLVTLNLTIKPTQVENFNIESCESYIWNDAVFTESGAYQQLFVNSTGCDSLVTLNLTINPVDVIVNAVNEQLLATAPMGNFQWVDCDNGFAPISGAISNLFSPLSNGNYAVIYNAENCEQTSDCFNVNWMSIENLNLVFNLFPIPTDNNLQIHCLNCNLSNQGALTYSITDAQGKLVLQNKFIQTENVQTLSVSHLASGSYFLHISNANKRLMSKVFLKQ